MPRASRGRMGVHLVAAVAGCLVGLVGGGFRWCLARAAELRGSLVEASEQLGALGPLVPAVLTATGAAVACAIALRVPLSAGSGIQDVEAVWRGERSPGRRGCCRPSSSAA